ncbi:hypothetical protein ACWGBO_14845 [[Kitasatospora] papulosa]
MRSLPDELVDFFAGLAPGDMIVLARAGDFAATVTAAGGPLEGASAPVRTISHRRRQTVRTPQLLPRR